MEVITCITASPPSARKIQCKHRLSFLLGILADGHQNRIGAATSNTLEQGSWTDHGSIGLTSTDGSPYNAIDPTVNEVHDMYYVTFGSYWGDIYQVTLGPKALAITETPTNQIQYQPSGKHNAEAASIYYYGDYYYLFWSEGQANRYAADKPAAGGEYKVRVCRSCAISGPYEDSSGTSCTEGGGDYVLESHGQVYGPGAQGIIDDPTFGSVMYYRYGKPFIGNVTPSGLVDVFTNG